MKLLKIPRKSVSKVFHPLGRFPRGNGEILCVSQGLFYVIRFARSDAKKIQFHENARLVLRTDFRLVCTMYGVPQSVLAYEDISIPSQVITNDKTVVCRLAC